MHTAPKPQWNNHEQTNFCLSRFREIVVAGLRADKRKNTTNAVEEVRRGLITFTRLDLSQAHQSIIAKDAGEPIRITASAHDAFSSLGAGEGP